MAAQGPHLGIAQSCVGAFGDSPVTQSTERHVWRQACFLSDLGKLVAEIVRLPREMGLPLSIRRLASCYHRPVAWSPVQPLHKFRPQGGAIFIVKRNVDQLRSEEHTSELQSREKLVCR